MAKDRQPPAQSAPAVPPADNPPAASPSPMKKACPLIKKALDVVWLATASLQRGGIIHWELIESAIGLDRNHDKTKTLVLKLKKKFEKERHITIWSEPEIGYRLLTHQEQLEVAPEKRARRARRQIRKGIGHMQSIPDEELTDHQRQLRAAKVQGQKRVLRQANQASRQDKAMNRPTNGNRPFR